MMVFEARFGCSNVFFVDLVYYIYVNACSWAKCKGGFFLFKINSSYFMSFLSNQRELEHMFLF